MMRTLALFVVFIACCGGQEPPFDLEIKGSSLRVGSMIHIRVAEQDGDVLISNESFPVNDVELDVTYGGLLADQVAYRIDLFQDLDEDGACSEPPADKVWTLETSPVLEKVILDLGRIEQDGSACPAFE